MKRCEKLDDAKANGLIRYFTGRPCHRGHVCARLVSDRSCIECNRVKAQEHRDSMTTDQKYDHGLKYRHLQTKWLKTEKGIASKKETVKKYYQNNKNKLIEYRKKYNSATNNFHSKEWKKMHPERLQALSAKRRSAKIRRMPNWLNAGHRLEIDSVYALCNAWRSIGFDYHVDHIAPLQGKSVSGLHVPWNLQILPAKENISKGNRYE